MFRLALALGRTVGELVETMSFEELVEWHDYADLEPFGEWRADVRSAQIVTMLANLNRDSKKQPNPFKISDFMLEFGKAAANAKPKDGAVISTATVAWLFAQGNQSGH